MDEAEEEWIRLIFDEARDTRNSTYENFSKLFSPACDSIAYNEQYYSGFVVYLFHLIRCFCQIFSIFQDV